MEVSEIPGIDSENRLAIGGRKRSSRRSSILKSPVKGVLEDLDPNALVTGKENRDKKSRRSSGRRVSFAEKNQIKEFCKDEDWNAAWLKDKISSGNAQGQQPTNYQQMPSSEYRQPTTIKGLQSLLSGSIQCQEQQFQDQNVTTRFDSDVCMDFTICHNQATSEQLVAQPSTCEATQIFSNAPDDPNNLDLTCHGRGFINKSTETTPHNPMSFLKSLLNQPASQAGSDLSQRQWSDQDSDDNGIDMTECHGKGVLATTEGIKKRRSILQPADVDVTQCYSGPITTEQINPTSFFQSLTKKTPSDGRRDNFPCKIPSQVDEDDKIESFQKRRSIIQPCDVDMTQCYGGSIDTGKSNPTPKYQFEEDDIEFTSCYGKGLIGNKESFQKRRSIIQPCDVDTTQCYGGSIDTGKSNPTPKDQFEEDDIEFTSCYGKGLIGNKESFQKRRSIIQPYDVDTTQCYGGSIDIGKSNPTPKDQFEDSNIEFTSCYGKGLLGNKENIRKRISIIQPCDVDTTQCYGGSIDTGKSNPTPKDQFEEDDIEFTTCYGKGLLGNRENIQKRRSIIQPCDVDMTQCYGGLIDTGKSNPTQKDQFRDDDIEFTSCYGKGLLGNKESYQKRRSIIQPCDIDMTQCFGGTINTQETFPMPEIQLARDESIDFTVCHGKVIVGDKESFQKRRSIVQPCDIDMTQCYGGAINTDKNSNIPSHITNAVPDISMQQDMFEDIPSSDELELTECQGTGQIIDSYHTENKASKQEFPALDLTACHGGQIISGEPHNPRQSVQTSSEDVDLTVCTGKGLIMEDEQETVKSKDWLSQTAPISSSKDLQYMRSLPSLSKSQYTSPDANDVLSPVTSTCDSDKIGGYWTAGPMLSSLEKTTQEEIKSNAYSDTRKKISTSVGLMNNEDQENQPPMVYPSHPKAPVPASTCTKTTNAFQMPDVVTENEVQMDRKMGEYIDLTFCYGGVLNTRKNTQERRSIMQPTDVDLTGCFGGAIDTGLSSQITGSHISERSTEKEDKQHSIYVAQDLDLNKCQNVGQLEEPAQADNNGVEGQTASLDLTTSNDGTTIPGDVPHPRNNICATEAVELNVDDGKGSLIGSAEKPGEKSDREIDWNSKSKSWLNRTEPIPSSQGIPSEYLKSLSSLSRSQYLSPDTKDEVMPRAAFGPVSTVPISRFCAQSKKRGLVKVESPSEVGMAMKKRKEEPGPLANASEAEILLENEAERSLLAGNDELGHKEDADCLEKLRTEEADPSCKENKAEEDMESDTCTEVTNRTVPSNNDGDNEVQFARTVEEAVFDNTNENGQNQEEMANEAHVEATESPVEQANDRLYGSEVGIQDEPTLEMNFTDGIAIQDEVPLSAATVTTEEEEEPADNEMPSEHDDKKSSEGQDTTTTNANDVCPEPKTLSRNLSTICEESYLDKDSVNADPSTSASQKHMTVAELLAFSEISDNRVTSRRSTIAFLKKAEKPKSISESIRLSYLIKPKAERYVEMCDTVEKELITLRSKIEAQERELNASSAAILYRAGSASPSERSELASELKKLHFACKKHAKGNWSDKKTEMKRKIVYEMKQHHETLKGDLDSLDETLTVASDCSRLLDEIDKEIDTELADLRDSLSSSGNEDSDTSPDNVDLGQAMPSLRTREAELEERGALQRSLASEKDRLTTEKENLEREEMESTELLSRLQGKVSFGDNDEELQHKYEWLKELSEWKLEEWETQHARFTFLYGTLDLNVEFGDALSDIKARGARHLVERRVQDISLNSELSDDSKANARLAHALIYDVTTSASLLEMCPTSASLPKVLHYLSGLVITTRNLADEVFAVNFSHILSVSGTSVFVEFCSVQTFMKFIVQFTFDATTYPDLIVFNVTKKIGQFSPQNVEEILQAVAPGPKYLTRLVQAADTFLMGKHST